MLNTSHNFGKQIIPTQPNLAQHQQADTAGHACASKGASHCNKASCLRGKLSLLQQPKISETVCSVLLQSKSQSRLYQSKAVHESEAAVLIPAVQASAAGKAPKQQATVVSPPASPARRILVNESPAKMAQVAAEMLHDKAGEVRGACSL